MDFPLPYAVQIAKNLYNLRQVYNKEDLSTEVKARGQVLGEDGLRVQSMVLPGLPSRSSTTVYFSGPGEVYSDKHDIRDVRCLMPGLLLAVRKVVHLKNLVNGLEKFLYEGKRYSITSVHNRPWNELIEDPHQYVVSRTGLWLGDNFVGTQSILDLLHVQLIP